jgi:predicted RNA-binding protein YlxR (DUF448 family)
VRTPGGSVVIDPGGKVSGRGAYLHESPECWSIGLNRSTLARALKLETIPDNDLRTLTDHALGLSISSPRP